MSDGDDESTTIPVTKATRKRLKLWKTEHEMTYNEAIEYLLDEQENEEDDQ